MSKNIKIPFAKAYVERLDPVNGKTIEQREALNGNVLRVERLATTAADQSHPMLVIRYKQIF